MISNGLKGFCVSLALALLVLSVGAVDARRFRPQLSNINSGDDLVLDLVLDGSRALDSRFTFTRSSSKTCWDSAGVLQTLGNNVPCFEYDFTNNNAPLGLSIEDPRTNVVLQSEDLGTTWTLTGTIAPTLTVNNIAAPDGNTTADKVAFGANADSRVQQVVTTNTSANTEYTFSVYAKVTSGTEDFRLQFNDDVTGDQLSADLTATTSWQRFTLTKTFGAASTSRSISIRNKSGGTVGNVWFWGVQLEAGSFETSYIKTTTATVIRTADIATIEASAIPGLEVNKFSIYVEHRPRYAAPSGVFPKPFKINNAAFTQNFIFMYGQNNTSKIAFQGSGMSPTTFVSKTGFTVDKLMKAMVAFAVNDVAFVTSEASGVAVDTTAAAISDLGQIELNDASVFGHTTRIKIWNTRKPNGFLQNMVQ